MRLRRLLDVAVFALCCPSPIQAAPEPRNGPNAATLSSFVTAQNASSSDIALARKMVRDAIVEMTKRNKARMDSPARNRFKLQPGTKLSSRGSQENTPLLNITTELSHAAALVSETDFEIPEEYHPSASVNAAGGTFWMGSIDRKGSVPWGNDSSYKVFRNVLDYGADNTGKKDSTKAIQKAISDGGRCGAGCNGATTKNAIVYFPAGTYRVSSSISVYFGTQIIGDANSPPTIFASPSFLGLGVMSTDVYVENGGIGPDGNALEWYINTARFYSQIRNLKFNIMFTNDDAHIAAIHYQVAQASTIENVELSHGLVKLQGGLASQNSA